MKRISLALLAIALFSVGSLSLIAQSSYGTVGGTVTDPTGAAVPNATVTIKSVETGETRTAITKPTGGFLIESVGTGHYDVTAEAPSFAKVVVQSVAVVASVITSVNPVLQVGKQSDTVEVSSGREILQTESGEISKTINSVEVSELPINSLNAYNLVTTLPGVTTVTAGSTGNGGAFSVNGSRPRANNYLIEGQDNNDAGLTGQGLQPQNTESIQNVTFLLNGYNPEYGYAGGGVSNVVFKSGTNQFHGSVYDRLLNSSLNAISHNNKLNGNFNKTKFRENIYGGTFGGPILHNKLFFFGAYQQDHYRSSSILSILTVPTVNGYATLNKYATNPRIANLVKAYGGLQGATPASGLYSSQSKTIALGLDPVTGLDRGNVEYGGVQRIVASNTNASELDLKGDWLINPSKDKLQVRFIRSYSIVPYDTGNFPSQLPFFDTNQGGPAENAGIVYTHIFSPTLLNEVRLSYGRISYVFDLRPDTYSNPLAIGPTISITGVQGYGIPTNVPQGRSHNTYQLQDALSWSHGPHTIKGGFDVNQIRVRDAVPFVFYGTIAYVANNPFAAAGSVPAVGAYTALANYMDDYSGYTSSTGQSITQNFGSNIARPKLTQQNYYIQDHWKASPRLAVDYGLRYEYVGAPFNYLSNPATDFSNPFGSFTTGVKQQPQFKNFAPRLGFAYQPLGDNKTVIRGAVGIFYDHLFTNIVDNLQAAAPNAASPIAYGAQTTSGRGTPGWTGVLATLSKTPVPLNPQTTIDSHMRTPITYQYNLAIERQLPMSFTMTVAYAGSRGEHLYGLETLNPVIAATSLRVNTARGSITAFDTTGDSNYNALQLDIERKYQHGFEARFAYTYAKALDDVSDPYTSGNISAYAQIQPTLPTGAQQRGLEWGLSAYDHRHRAVGTIIYNTPVFHPDGMAKSILAHIINNYTLSTIPSYQSGTTYNVQAGLDMNNDGITNDRPVLTNASAPINTYSVASQTFYTTAQGAAPGVYCDGSYYNNASTKNPVTGLNDNFCHPVQLSQMHWYIGDYHVTTNQTIRRDAGITPGIFGMDAAAQRTFKIGERQAISFRAESFNVLNHANTGVPSFTLNGTTLLPIASGYGRGTFGNYASTGTGNRTLRFFLRYAF